MNREPVVTNVTFKVGWYNVSECDKIEFKFGEAGSELTLFSLKTLNNSSPFIPCPNPIKLTFTSSSEDFNGDDIAEFPTTPANFPSCAPEQVYYLPSLATLDLNSSLNTEFVWTELYGGCRTGCETTFDSNLVLNFPPHTKTWVVLAHTCSDLEDIDSCGRYFIAVVSTDDSTITQFELVYESATTPDFDLSTKPGTEGTNIADLV